MYMVEYELWGYRKVKGVWNIDVDTLREAVLKAEEHCAKVLEVLEVTLMCTSAYDYTVYVDGVHKGRFELKAAW